MVWSALCKLLQKQTLDVLSHRYGTLIIVGGIILLFISAFQFGEVTLEWSKEKYAAVFNSFSDNVAGKSYQSRLCLPVPIDVVYTWVNGTDPKLLADLRRFRAQMEMELNLTRISQEAEGEEMCIFAHCLPSTVAILDPALPEGLTVGMLATLYPAFKKATRLFHLHNPHDMPINITVAVFETKQDVEAALNARVMVHGRNVTIKQGYYTSDWTLKNSILLEDTIIMTGFPHKYTAEKLKEQLPPSHRKAITKFTLHEDKGVVLMMVPKKGDFDNLLQDTNITIEGKKPTLSAANLIWDLHDYSQNEELSASRFRDNEELRYSIRSIERFAPWVRHVYIVTNGQIPTWLNLDNPRVTLVTHKEIFSNLSHLPTFSSPAIEAHLHKIPGLSDKFIYLNDDVMFGKEVWPDDFYSHAYGQKVHMTWPVPNCREGCPSTWIRDGYCDKACNNSECEWDGGDCSGGARYSYGGGAMGGAHHAGWIRATDKMYCNSGCANNWIADRYCDQACNVKACGFDAGDCGTVNFHLMLGIDVVPEVTSYTMPRGETVAFFNVTQLFGINGKIEHGDYEDNSAIRAATIAQKFKTVHVVLHRNQSATTVHIKLKGKTIAEEKVQFNFSVSVDSTLPPGAGATQASKQMTAKPTEGSKVKDGHQGATDDGENKDEEQPAPVNVTKVPPFVFKDVPFELQYPKPSKVKIDDWMYVSINLSQYDLPANISQQLMQIEAQMKTGELTEKGHNLKRNLVWYAYVQDLQRQGLAPPTLPPPTLLAPSNISGASLHTNITADHDAHKFKFGSYLRKKNDEKQKRLEKTNQEDRDGLRKNGQFEVRHKLAGDEKEEGNKNTGMPSKGDLDEYKMPEHRSRKLQMVYNVDRPGFLPWEKQKVFNTLTKIKEAADRRRLYAAELSGHRHLMDTFADSLRHVNRIYNRLYGYVSRKVPAHMPHMVDKHIMAELQTKLPQDWDTTSGHKLRSSDDMQFAFAYFYFLMSEPKNISVEEIFEEMDVDQSGVLSDREMRTLATRLYPLPLDLQTLTGLEKMVINCSKHVSKELIKVPPGHPQEKYYDGDMPQVTQTLVVNCAPLVELIHKTFKNRTKYKFQTVSDDEVAFKMIHTNVSNVVAQLDDIRKHPKKFVCLNDNIDHSKEEANTVRAVLQDFYESMFPIPSSFELPREYRNRFLHVDELREWRQYRDWLKMWTHLALAALIIFTAASFFSDKFEALHRRLFRRRITSTVPPLASKSSSSSSTESLPSSPTKRDPSPEHEVQRQRGLLDV